MLTISRRTLLQGAAASVLMVTGTGCSFARSNPNRNVLFISIDDLNDWIEPLGGYPGKVHTPNLDRLARQGILFTNANCSGPACNPSRSSLMTGRSPTSCGIRNNTQDFRDTLPEVKTLPQYFALSDYRTAASGKVFHNNFPDLQSWQESFELPYVARPSGAPLNGTVSPAEFRDLPRHLRRVDWGPTEHGLAETADGLVASWAVEYLRRTHEDPFFFGVGFVAPHIPWYIPQEFFDLYPQAEIQLPPVLEEDLDDVGAPGRRRVEHGWEMIPRPAPERWRQMVQSYLAAVSLADGCLGLVLDAWEEGGYAENSIVMLWSDHGFHLGEKLHFAKGTLWEESIRVPLIIRAPGVEAGSQCHRPVSLLDLYPTLVELCGLPEHKELEGQSLVPLLRSPQTPWPRPALANKDLDHWTLRGERYRYISYATDEEELYDLESDPDEWHNLVNSPDHAEILSEMREWLVRLKPTKAK